jgi:hypothetical protein
VRIIIFEKGFTWDRIRDIIRCNNKIESGEGGDISDEYAETGSFYQGTEVTGSDVLKVLAEGGATYPQGNSPIGAADILPMWTGDRDGDAHSLTGRSGNEQES